ncbi:aminopeptidase [Haloarchaeobius litoreus]|uniref:Aminopeptidase n=1 Tax=Haloarchaeobius litoreus TaxID=755306 RepID=A0ABD6DDU5_9EURY|nr:aminopeptidase [Haloarchaeobius litoreus]
MDDRVREHARIIVEHSIDLQAGDEVLLSGGELAEDLLIALHEEIGKRGAFPVVWSRPSRAHRAFMHAMDPENYDDVPDTLAAMVEHVDATVGIRAAKNTHEQGDIPPEKNTAMATLFQPIQSQMMEKRWVGTQYPAPGNAQDAEMSTEAYEEFVWNAINKDWEEQREFQQPMADRLDEGSEVHIVSGDTTDIVMSIEGTVGKNDHAENNLPGGEVFTAPVPDSVEGEVLFDMPLMAHGREVQDVHLTFEDGEVVDFSAGKNEEVLAAVLDTDDGAKRIGELGIGMNRDIDRFTYNMLFDEKMGDTVHMALGRAYEENVPEDCDVERNESAIHMDMIVDMSEDSTITIDGELVQQDGTFWFEDGFEE